MKVPTLLAAILLMAASCGPTDDGSLSYDPPGSTITTDKEIHLQPRRTIGVRDTDVWVSNEYEGARLNDFYRDGAASYRAVIRPENAPINNSAWYGFKIWSGREQEVVVNLTYEDGTHRYVPKLSHDGLDWTPIDSALYRPDTTDGTAKLTLAIGPDTLWISAQERLTSTFFKKWMEDLAEREGVSMRRFGESREGRALDLLEIGDQADAIDYVFVISRQHPPEVTGTLALLAFLERISGNTELAARFRERFLVVAVPLVNPDGVDNGHWRHNRGGIDLNRDWAGFNQPEVRQLRDLFLSITEESDVRVHFAIDFHSTQEDVFYTVDRQLEAFPDGLIDEWLDAIRTELPDYVVNDEPFGLGSPVSKNWFYEMFGTTSLTYEVGDEQDRALIRTISETGADAMMQLLLDGSP